MLPFSGLVNKVIIHIRSSINQLKPLLKLVKHLIKFKPKALFNRKFEIVLIAPWVGNQNNFSGKFTFSDISYPKISLSIQSI